MPFTHEFYQIILKQLAQKNASLGEPTFPKSHESIKDLYRFLESLAHHDEYYVALDLKGENGEPIVIWTAGIKRCLGYDDHTWSFFNSLSIVEKTYFDRYMRFALAAYEVVKNDVREPLKSLQQRYVIYIPVIKANNRIAWVKQMSMPLRLDQYGKVIHQLNCFTILCDYNDAEFAFFPRFFDINGEPANDLNKKLIKLVGADILNAFTSIQVETIQAYFELKQAGKKKPTAEKLAVKLTRAQTSIISRQDDIRARASEIFMRPFKNFHDTMGFLSQEYGDFIRLPILTKRKSLD